MARTGKSRYPDFTIEDPESGITVYWATFGPNGRPGHRSRWQKKLYGAMMRREIPYHWVTMNWRNRVEAMDANDKVRVSTFQALKGVEFSRVFLCGVNKIYDPGGDDEETLRRLVYVGMTRAIDELVITVSGGGPIGRAIQEAAI